MSEGKGLLHILCSMVHKDDYVSDRRSAGLLTTLVLLLLLLLQSISSLICHDRV